MQNCKIYDTPITKNKNMAVQYLQDLDKNTSKPLNIPKILTVYQTLSESDILSLSFKQG